jgi:RNA polymerase sigma-70 factor (ECF subfamily)
MTDRLEDTALMLRYQDGDLSAFESLYRRHNDALYRYLLRLCLNRHTAEDLFQEAWGKIIRSRDRYRPRARFKTYLFRVAHNCFIDHCRRNKRHTAEVASDVDAAMSDEDGPEDHVERILARRKLDQALASLPDEQRDVFLLYEEGGLTIDEIGLVTGVNRETAKSRLRYANAKLKTALVPGRGQP